MTARFGPWDRLLIRLSVSPSLRYSVLGSLLALTKGRTASEEISCWLLRRRDRKTAAATSASTKATARPATQRRLPEAGTASGPETRIWGAVSLPVVDVGAAPTVDTALRPARPVLSPPRLPSGWTRYLSSGAVVQ